MKASSDKSHFLVGGKDKGTIGVEKTETEKSKKENLLRIKIDSRHSFTEYLNYIVRKASREVNALSRITLYMNMDKKRIIMNSYFSSQLSYCPLVWMFHSRTTNNKIIRLHKRCLRVIYNDKTSFFENLLEKGRSLQKKTFKHSKIYSHQFFERFFIKEA